MPQPGPSFSNFGQYALHMFASTLSMLASTASLGLGEFALHHNHLCCGLPLICVSCTHAAQAGVCMHCVASGPSGACFAVVLSQCDCQAVISIKQFALCMIIEPFM